MSGPTGAGTPHPTTGPTHLGLDAIGRREEIMSYQPFVRSVLEDRDLSRAAHERYLMLQALSERQAAAPDPRRSRLATFLRAVRALRPGSPRTTVTAEQATTAK